MRVAASSNARAGSSFDEFLKEENILDNAVGLALLRVFAWKIREAMKAKAITKAEMAKRMNTSRSGVDRLLEPTSDKVELATLVRAADAAGHKLSLDLVARSEGSRPAPEAGGDGANGEVWTALPEQENPSLDR